VRVPALFISIEIANSTLAHDDIVLHKCARSHKFTSFRSDSAAHCEEIVRKSSGSVGSRVRPFSGALVLPGGEFIDMRYCNRSLRHRMASLIKCQS
jgi:hypothetical protein